ncbi:MAG TPA: BrnT family toxin [Stellaceae bacterium]|nr:BrnT family toxin [Stellaceae bacterium]
MDIEYDSTKDRANRAKHGLPLALGRIVLENLVGEDLDVDHTDEERIVAFGMVGIRLFVCVYTLRGSACRIISIRRATKAEAERWLS